MQTNTKIYQNTQGLYVFVFSVHTEYVFTFMFFLRRISFTGSMTLEWYALRRSSVDRSTNVSL